MNITQGDNSFMAGAVDFTERPPGSPGTASAGAEAIGGVPGVAAVGATAAGAAVEGTVAGPAAAGAVDDGAAEGAVCCWAETGNASQAATSITAAARLARRDMIFILRPSGE
ncbi:hypothetical protein S23_43290 [Bradyrhizobium cosmicum]|uniref:Uncharacterized protein n=1 Tax=Bradyrhizobium cosmicum TaxID=1404864 RepID=A0AAI8MFJ9_9BRAD|nr:hypothetical protein S23_43290 [Bradyrhizobium cosmicum]